MIKLLFALLFLIDCLAVNAQQVNESDYPVIGKPCPVFVLHHVKYYSKDQVTLQDFNGKWLVLEFWSKHCGACVASFPRVSAMQKEFGDKVKFMLVGIQDQEKEIEPVFAKFRQKENLVMPCAFDSLLANRWDVDVCPRFIIVDDQGIVRAITYSYHREEMQGFLNGNPPHMDNPARYAWEKDPKIPFDEKKPYLIKGNGGIDTIFKFRSLLSGFDELFQQSYIPDSIAQDAAFGRFQVLGARLSLLYNYAYYGKLFPTSSYHTDPVLEIKDSALFRYNSYNKFCYSLILPLAKATGKHMQEILQRDLKDYFGFEAQIEERNFPFFKLVVTDEGRRKLKTKGGKYYCQELPHTGVLARNCPFGNLLLYVRKCVSPGPIIDATNIMDNIDISIDWIDTNFDSVKEALHEKGLDLVREEMPMKVLVIKDPTEK